MKKLLKKLARATLQISLAAISFALVLVIVMQCALVIGINMFSKGRAHDLVQNQVTAALAGSGYNLTFASLYYDPVRGFTLYDIALSDEAGILMTLDRFSLAVDLVKIPRRLLVLEGHAGTLDIARLPAGRDDAQAEETALAAFDLPDIFFRRLQITLLKIDRLNLPESVAGRSLTLAPALKAVIDLRQDIAFDLALAPQAAATIGNVPLPDRLAVRGVMDPRQLSLTLDRAVVLSSAYNAEASGTISLQTEGLAALKIKASYADLTALTQGQLQSFALHAAVTGAADAPAIQLDGTIIPAALKEKGLADIKLQASTQNTEDAVTGLIELATSYRDQPITLETALSYTGERITFDSIKGTAPEITLSGKGVLTRTDMMFDGALDAEAHDLSYYQDLTGLALAGKGKLAVMLAAKEGAQAAAIDATLDGVRYGDISLARAQIGTALADMRNPWPDKADIKASGLTLAPDMTITALNATITGKDDVYRLSLDGNGNLPVPLSFTAQANITDIADPLPTLRDITATVRSGASTLHLNGVLGKDAVDLTLATKSFRSADIPAALPDNQEPFTLDATIKMTGTPAAPATTLDAVINGLSAGDYKGLSLKATGVHTNPTASLDISGTGTGIRVLRAQATLPLQFALYPFTFSFDEGGLNGSFAGDLDIAPIAALFLPPTLAVSGDLDAEGTLAGAVTAPKVEGTATVRNGAFSDTANGITLRDIALDAALTQSGIAVRHLTATDGEKGTLQGQGRMAFGAATNTDLALVIKEFHFPQSDLADGYLDAGLTLEDSPGGFHVYGNVDIRQMNIIIPETFQSKIPELNIVERNAPAERKPPLDVALNIKIDAPNQVFVHGWGLDAEFGGAIDVTGLISAPQFNGDLSSIRGRYEEFGKRFTLARADLRFQGAIPPSPYLDIEATIPADDVMASVLLTGPAKSPAIKFAATPALPEDEVLSRILFGRGTARITPFQAIQLTQTIQRFSGQGGSGLNPLGLLRETTGLDDITVDTDETGAASVGVGKYLTDKVYLELEKGKGPASGAASIQIEVTPNINVESEVGQDARVGGGVFWKRDY